MTDSYKKIGQVQFPEVGTTLLNVNMMPFIMGVKDSLPEGLHGYWPIIEKCTLNKFDIVYLTIRETLLEEGQTQSRTGIHTDGVMLSSPKKTRTQTPNPPTRGVWGSLAAGAWGGGSSISTGPYAFFSPIMEAAAIRGREGTGEQSSKDGIFIASSDGRCLVWDCETLEVDNHGAIKPKELMNLSKTPAQEIEASCLYWMSDRVPHMALPSKAGVRQFFRLVGPHIYGWFSKHNTENPLGVKPNAPIINSSKF